MASTLVKAIIDNAVIVSAIESKSIVNKAVSVHNLSPVAAVAMGRALTMAALMGKELKNRQDYLTATVDGGGPLGKITVCADALGHVKGDVFNPNAESVFKADGTLDVRRLALLRVGKPYSQRYAAGLLFARGIVISKIAGYFAAYKL